MNNLIKKHQRSLNCILRRHSRTSSKSSIGTSTNYDSHSQFHSKKKDFFVNSTFRSFHISRQNEESGNEDLNTKYYKGVNNLMNVQAAPPVVSSSSLLLFQIQNPSHVTSTLTGTIFTSQTPRFFSTTSSSSSSSSSPNNNSNPSTSDSESKPKTILQNIQKYGFTFIGCYFLLWSTTLSTIYISLDNNILDPITLTQIELPWHHGSESSVQEDMITEKKEFESTVDYIVHLMEGYSWLEGSGLVDYVRGNPKVGNLALAFIATKVTEPVRIGLCLSVVPRVSRWLGNKIDEKKEEKEMKKNKELEGEEGSGK